MRKGKRASDVRAEESGVQTRQPQTPFPRVREVARCSACGTEVPRGKARCPDPGCEGMVTYQPMAAAMRM